MRTSAPLRPARTDSGKPTGLGDTSARTTAAGMGAAPGATVCTATEVAIGDGWRWAATGAGAGWAGTGEAQAVNSRMAAPLRAARFTPKSVG